MGLLLGALMATGSQAQTDKEKGNEIVPWNNPITERFGYANSVRKNNSTRWTVPNSLIRTDLVEVWGVGGSLIFNKKSVRYVDWAIPAQYERVSREFSEGLSGVVLNGRMGFIDRHNRFLIPPRFEETEELHGFSQGLAAIRIGGKYGFINKRGEIVIEPIYEWADNFRDNLLASVKMDGKFGAIDLTGQLVVPCEYKLEEAMINIPISNKAYRNAAKEVEAKKENGEYAPTLNAIQEAANEIDALIGDPAYLPPIPEREYLIQMDNDSLGVTVEEADSIVWILRPEYTDIQVISEGLMLVERQDSLLGVADHFGRIVLPCDYQDIEYQDSLHLFITQEDSLYGLFDENGIELLPTRLDAIEDFTDGKANVWMNGQQGWVDTRGDIQEGFLDNVYQSAVTLEEAGATPQARLLYERILDINPGYALAYNNLGILELNAENYGLGIKKLKLANQLDPDNEMIAENYEQAKKDRKERRWNRVMKGLETAQVVLGVAATTYNTVEAVKGTNNFVDVDAVVSGTASPEATSSDMAYMPTASYNPNSSELAREQEKLQQLQLRRQAVVNRRNAALHESSREGLSRTQRAGTSLRLNRGQVRPGQGNYGRGVAERRSYEFSSYTSELKRIDRQIAASRQRIRALQDGGSSSDYASSARTSADRSSEQKGIRNMSDQHNFNTDKTTYFNAYTDLCAMRDHSGSYRTSTISEINNARREKQALMKHIRERWEAKGESIGNSETIAMENWVP